MHTYTFILDYLGGTYISQVVEKLEIVEIQGLSENDKQNIILSKFDDEKPILLKKLTNVWHFLISTNKGVGYVNFVKTCDIDCSCKCI